MRLGSGRVYKNWKNKVIIMLHLTYYLVMMLL